MLKPLQKARLALLTGLALGAVNASAQINLSGSSYQENFDVMGAAGTTLPTGWAALRIAGSGTANQELAPTVSNGDATSGGVYNVGTASATDRALGSLGSGSTAPAFGVQLKNTSGSTITKLDLAAVMEQWRTGSAADIEERLIFEYSTDATSLSSGTWTAVPAIDLVEKLTSNTAASTFVDGNLNDNKTAVTGSVVLQLANNEVVWLRWKDTNDGGTDGMYAIDDLVITPTYATTTGVKESSVESIGFYPNPATSVSKLTLPAGFAVKGDVSLTLYNPAGKAILKASGAESALNEKLVSALKTAAAGVYVLRVGNGAQSYQTKIVKN